MARAPSRDDNGTTAAGSPASCPVCRTPFTRVRRRAYCSDICRKTAWRRRQSTPPAPPTPPAGRPHRDATVYECTECETRYLGEQWCFDCVRPCRKISLGGTCPHCDQVVAVEDLLDTAEPPPRQEVIAIPAL